jgi:hypothetical protein
MTRRELMTAVARAGLIAALSDFSNFFDGGNVMAQEKISETAPHFHPRTAVKTQSNHWPSMPAS